MKILPTENDPLPDLKPFIPVKLIVTDLDGTLTSHSNDFFDRVRRDTKYMRSKKRYFTIATGRSLNGAQPILSKIQLTKGTPIILYNGTVVLRYLTPEIIHTSEISQGSMETILDIVFKYSLSAYASRLDTEIYKSNNGIITQDCEIVNGWGRVISERDYNGLWVNWNSIEKWQPPTTVVIKCDDNAMTEVCNSLNKILDIDVTTSGTGYIEIAPQNCNKGNALDIVRCKFGWPKGSILCIGDNDNDIPLLNKADIGIVVGNASEMAKDAADYICRSDGVTGVLDVIDTIKDTIRYYELR